MKPSFDNTGNAWFSVDGLSRIESPEEAMKMLMTKQGFKLEIVGGILIPPPGYKMIVDRRGEENVMIFWRKY